MRNVLEFFEKTTIEYPNKIGFTDSSRKATFSEVMKNAKAIGTYLSQEGTKRPVAILIDKSVRCIESMLGAMYAGDFYVVVDVHSPTDRIENILNTLDNPIIITDHDSLDLANSFGRAFSIYNTAVETPADEDKLSEIRSQMIDMDTAYILFTAVQQVCRKELLSITEH